MPERSKHQTGVAAEAFAAGLFAQAGYSVFVQYGANQPGYDLLVSDGSNERLGSIKVSVKGTSDGYWLLCPPQRDRGKGGISKQEALEIWVKKNLSYVFCFVSFCRFEGPNPKPVSFGEMPLVYLATGEEVAEELRVHEYGKPAHYLAVYGKGLRGANKGKQLGIESPGPGNGRWRMTDQRIKEVFRTYAGNIGE